MSDKLIKEAAAAVRQLKNEVSTLTEEKEQLSDELDHVKTATAVALRLFKEGSIAAEDLVNAIEDFIAKTDEELNVIEKAAELFEKAGEPLLFGRLSDRSQDDGLTPEARFVAALQED